MVLVPRPAEFRFVRNNEVEHMPTKTTFTTLDPKEPKKSLVVVPGEAEDALEHGVVYDEFALKEMAIDLLLKHTANK